MTDQAHPIPVGSKVTIVRVGRFAGPFIEGTAIIKNSTRTADAYRVLFDGEKIARKRLVFSEFQSDPERLTAILLALWRAEDPGYRLADFFPDTSSWPEV